MIAVRDAAFGRIRGVLACADGPPEKFALHAIKNRQHPVDKRQRSRLSCNIACPAGGLWRIALGLSRVLDSALAQRLVTKTSVFVM